MLTGWFPNCHRSPLARPYRDRICKDQPQFVDLSASDERYSLCGWQMATWRDLLTCMTWLPLFTTACWTVGSYTEIPQVIIVVTFVCCSMCSFWYSLGCRWSDTSNTTGSGAIGIQWGTHRVAAGWGGQRQIIVSICVEVAKWRHGLWVVSIWEYRCK